MWIILLKSITTISSVCAWSSSVTKRPALLFGASIETTNYFAKRCTLCTMASSNAKDNDAAHDIIITTTTTKSCIPCSTVDKSHLLSIDDILIRIPNEIPLWQLTEKVSSDTGESYYLLSRSFITKNFQCALDCINAMGKIAEQEQHHPNFHLTNYRNVEIEIYTHTVNGITDNDITLAKLFDENVPIQYSPKWLKDHPEALSTSSKQTG